ncbi:signal recognition particle-docking protein FtsY [SAR202 cluster bacterium AD-804-J14_MRT_500m]|nr:signal recognition particle-docking protein FtsY [SAR202 cluster bacterium AD-804-J14_MRT_500m]
MGMPDEAKTSVAVERTRNTWFGHIKGMLSSSKLDESLWEDLEEILVSADVGIGTAMTIVEKLRHTVESTSIKTSEEVFAALKQELLRVLDVEGEMSSEEKVRANESPYVVLVVGVNGVGKTTSIAKLASHYKQMGNTVIIAAGDTFRAAAIDQIQILGSKIGIDVIAHQYGADPGAVAYDAFQAARARGSNILIIDTAGRLHTKTNLMEELRKIRSVINRLDSSSPQEVMLVLDATTGYNGLMQARAFAETVSCNGVFLSKMDGTAKGGVALAVKKELGLPIKYIGTGEQIEDMVTFDANRYLDALLAPTS